MPIPHFTASRQSSALKASIHEAVERVLDHQQFVLGNEVASFEKEIEKACLHGKAHAVGMSSGTDAPLAFFMAKKIGPGDAVITTPYTFFATAGAIHRVGAEIVFCDIEPHTYMMDSEKLRELLASFQRDPRGALMTSHGNRVRVIMPIHLFGVCCDMDSILKLAKEYDLMVIEDAAQAIGADYPSVHGPKKAGTIAEMSYFSFYPTKNLGAAGDAGMAVCQDPELAKQLRSIRNHGMEERYYHKVVGGNFRLDGLQAAILRAKLPFLEEWQEKRRKNAAIYRAAFEASSLLDHVSLPEEPFASSGLRNHHIYHQYVIRICDSAQSGLREKIMAHLSKKDIGYAIYYPVPLHLQECFAYLGHHKGSYPEAERAAKETLALPIFPELHKEEIDAVVEAIAEGINF